jgi:hypothetical protein
VFTLCGIQGDEGEVGSGEVPFFVAEITGVTVSSGHERSVLEGEFRVEQNFEPRVVKPSNQPLERV